MRLLILSYFLMVSLTACSSKPGSPAPLLDLSYDRSQFLYHEVLRYETLDDIESVYGVDKQVLKRTNDISKKHPIRPGMLIRVPEYIAESTQKKQSKIEYEKFKLPPHWGKLVHCKFSAQKDQRGGWKIYTKQSVAIYSPAKGKVIEISDKVKDLGRIVIIKHPDHRTSVYGLMSETVIKKGQNIKKGDLIGRSIKNNSGKSMFYYKLKKNI